MGGERFPLDGCSGNPGALTSAGRPPAGDRATHTALPCSEASVESRSSPLCAGAARSVARVSTAALRATSSGCPRCPRLTDDPRCGIRRRPIAALRQTERRGSTGDAHLHDFASDSVIVAPEWLVEEDESAPGFDTLAESRDSDTVEADPAETAETNDFRLQRLDQLRLGGLGARPSRRMAAEAPALEPPVMAQPISRRRGRKAGRIALIVAAGAAIGVGGTVLWSQYRAGLEPEADEPTSAAADEQRSAGRRADTTEPASPTVSPIPTAGTSAGSAGATEAAARMPARTAAAREKASTLRKLLGRVSDSYRRCRIEETGESAQGLPQPQPAACQGRTRPNSEVYRWAAG